MTDNNSKNIIVSGEIDFTGLIGLLTIVFIVLKLLNIINWSWWWVLAPLWLPVGIFLIIALIFIIIGCVMNRKLK